MPTPNIQPIENGESGASVRAKLNALIQGAVAGEFGVVTREDIDNIIDTVAPDRLDGLELTSTLVPEPKLIAVWHPSLASDFAYYELQLKVGEGNWQSFITTEPRYEVRMIPSTRFVGRVRPIDAAGNKGIFSEEYEHVTVRDDIPPATPIMMPAVAGLDTIWVQAQPNTETDLAFYEIYEADSETPAPSIETDATFVALSPTFVRSGLDTDQTRWYWMRAVDTSENRSPWSSPVTATTGTFPTSEVYTLEGVTFTPGRGAGNTLQWTIGSISYGLPGSTPVTKPLALGEVTWGGSTVYIYYERGFQSLSTTTNIITAYALNRKLIAVYKGGTDFLALDGKAQMSGDMLLAGTVGASQLVATQAVITGTIQIADSIISSAKIIDLDAAKLRAGTAIVGSLTVDGQPLSSVAASLIFQDEIVLGSFYRTVGTGNLGVASGAGENGGDAIGIPHGVVEWFEHKDLIPFDPAKTYRITFKVRRAGGDTGGSYFLGVNGFASDKTTRVNLNGANQVGSNFYCVAGGASTGSMADWPFTEYVAYIQGTSNPGGGVSPSPRSNPYKLHPSVKYFRLGGVVNYNIPAGSAGADVLIDMVKVESFALSAGEMVNAGNVQIEPGKIVVKGNTLGYLIDSWTMGGDSTEINGGKVAANSLAANTVTIGVRGITVEGLQFEHNSPSTNRVSWTSGTIRYVGDDGNYLTASIAGSSAAWTSSTLYVYWTKGAANLSATTALATAMASSNVVLAAYRGDKDLVTDYGRTVVDGATVKTGTITSIQVAAQGIKAVNIGADEVLTLHLKAQVVTTDKIIIGGVTTDRLDVSAVSEVDAAAANGTYSGTGEILTVPQQNNYLAPVIILSAVEVSLPYASVCQITVDVWTGSEWLTLRERTATGPSYGQNVTFVFNNTYQPTGSYTGFSYRLIIRTLSGGATVKNPNLVIMQLKK